MMREYLVRFLWKGRTHEEKVKARDDAAALEQVTGRYPGCKIVSILHL